MSGPCFCPCECCCVWKALCTEDLIRPSALCYVWGCSVRRARSSLGCSVSKEGPIQHGVQCEEGPIQLAYSSTYTCNVTTPPQTPHYRVPCILHPGASPCPYPYRYAPLHHAPHRIITANAMHTAARSIAITHTAYHKRVILYTVYVRA